MFRDKVFALSTIYSETRNCFMKPKFLDKSFVIKALRLKSVPPQASNQYILAPLPKPNPTEAFKCFTFSFAMPREHTQKGAE